MSGSSVRLFGQHSTSSHSDPPIQRHHRSHNTTYLSNSSIRWSSVRPPYTLNFFRLHTCVFSYLPNLMLSTMAGLSSFSIKYCHKNIIYCHTSIKYSHDKHQVIAKTRLHQAIPHTKPITVTQALSTVT